MWKENNTLNELEYLKEFSNLRKYQTGLPVNIWVDENQTYLDGGHSPRIKFQITKADDTRSNLFATMDLDGVIRKNSHYDQLKEITLADEEKIRQFVLNNALSLKALADQEIYKEDFDEIMIPGYNKMTVEEINLMVDKLNVLIKARSENKQSKLNYKKLLEKYNVESRTY